MKQYGSATAEPDNGPDPTFRSARGMTANPLAAIGPQVAAPQLTPELQGCHVPRDALQVERIIGRGQFGEVG